MPAPARPPRFDRPFDHVTAMNAALDTEINPCPDHTDAAASNEPAEVDDTPASGEEDLLDDDADEDQDEDEDDGEEMDEEDESYDGVDDRVVWGWGDGDDDPRWKRFYVVDGFTYRCPLGVESELRIALDSGTGELLAAELWRASDESWQPISASGRS